MVLAGGESGELQIWDLFHVERINKIKAHNGENN